MRKEAIVDPTRQAAEALVSKQSDDNSAPGAPGQTGWKGVDKGHGPYVKSAPKR